MNFSNTQNHTEGLQPSKRPKTHEVTTQGFLTYVLPGSFLVALIVFLFCFLLIVLHCNRKYCGKRSQPRDHQVNAAVENIYSADPTIGRNFSKTISDDNIISSTPTPAIFPAIVAVDINSIDTRVDDDHAYDNEMYEHVYMELP